jgi:hypothetical protein
MKMMSASKEDQSKAKRAASLLLPVMLLGLVISIAGLGMWIGMPQECSFRINITYVLVLIAATQIHGPALFVVFRKIFHPNAVVQKIMHFLAAFLNVVPLVLMIGVATVTFFDDYEPTLAICATILGGLYFSAVIYGCFLTRKDPFYWAYFSNEMSKKRRP